MGKVERGSHPHLPPRCSPGTSTRQWKCSCLTVGSPAGAGYPRRTGGGTKRGCTALLLPVLGARRAGCHTPPSTGSACLCRSRDRDSFQWRSWDLGGGGGIAFKKISLILPLQLKCTNFLFKEYSYNLNEEKGRFQLSPLIFDFSCYQFSYLYVSVPSTNTFIPMS